MSSHFSTKYRHYFNNSRRSLRCCKNVEVWLVSPELSKKNPGLLFSFIKLLCFSVFFQLMLMLLKVPHNCNWYRLLSSLKGYITDHSHVLTKGTLTCN